jgi:hypothetical protein
VAEARRLAAVAAEPLIGMARTHTAVSVERATLRLAGLSGADPASYSAGAGGQPAVGRVPYSHAHYGGSLVDGAYVLGLFGDVATELCIRSDGDEGLLAGYASVAFEARSGPATWSRRPRC